MKKFFVIAVMAVSVLAASAQNRTSQSEKAFSIKPYVGLSASELINKHDNTKMRVGFTLGAEAQYMLNKWFGLSGALAYQQQGGKEEEEGIKVTYKLDYINVPILANFYVCKGLALKAGVQPGFAVNTKAKASGKASGEYDATNDWRKFDVAIPLGISYEFYKVVLDARVNIGLIGVAKNTSAFEDSNPWNGTLQFTVGYRF